MTQARLSVAWSDSSHGNVVFTALVPNLAKRLCELSSGCFILLRVTRCLRQRLLGNISAYEIRIIREPFNRVTRQRFLLSPNGDISCISHGQYYYSGVV